MFRSDPIGGGPGDGRRPAFEEIDELAIVPRDRGDGLKGAAVIEGQDVEGAVISSRHQTDPFRLR